MQVYDQRKLRKHIIKEKPQPHAVAFIAYSDEAHAILPATGADERQAMLAKLQARENGTCTMFVEADCCFGPAGQIVIRVLVCVTGAAPQKGAGSSRTRVSPRGGRPTVMCDIQKRRERQPLRPLASRATGWQ